MIQCCSACSMKAGQTSELRASVGWSARQSRSACPAIHFNINSVKFVTSWIGGRWYASSSEHPKLRPYVERITFRPPRLRICRKTRADRPTSSRPPSRPCVTCITVGLATINAMLLDTTVSRAEVHQPTLPIHTRNDSEANHRGSGEATKI